jgi:hypothetical protein
MRAWLTFIIVALAIGVSARGTSLAAAPQETKSVQPQQHAHEEEPVLLLGTWRLNVAKSRYSPGPPVREETRVYTRMPEGIVGVVTRTHADGQVERFEYNANFGHEQMVTGNPDYDAVTLRKIDDYTSAVTLSHAGAVYGVGRRAISPDGKTLTLTFDRQNSDKPVHNVAIYEKQP